MIGGHAPSKYLVKLQEHKQVQLQDACMDQILLSHCIDPGSLRADAFEDFYLSRKAALVNLIEAAMGKSVVTAEGVGPTNRHDLFDEQEDDEIVSAV